MLNYQRVWGFCPIFPPIQWQVFLGFVCWAQGVKIGRPVVAYDVDASWYVSKKRMTYMQYPIPNISVLFAELMDLQPHTPSGTRSQVELKWHFLRTQ